MSRIRFTTLFACLAALLPLGCAGDSPPEAPPPPSDLREAAYGIRAEIGPDGLLDLEHLYIRIDSVPPSGRAPFLELARGEFLVPHYPLGTYRLELFLKWDLEAPIYRSPSKTLDNASGIDFGRIVVSRDAPALEISVRDLSGAPPGGGEVALEWEAPHAVMVRGKLDSRGRARILFPEEEARLTVRCPGYRPVETIPRSAAVEIVLQRFQAVEIRMLNVADLFPDAVVDVWLEHLESPMRIAATPVTKRRLNAAGIARLTVEQLGPSRLHCFVSREGSGQPAIAISADALNPSVFSIGEGSELQKLVFAIRPEAIQAAATELR